MKLYLTLVILFFIGGCEKVETLNGDSNDSFNNSAVIVSLQDSDNVAIVNAATLEIQDQINIDLVNCLEISNQMECEMAGCMWHAMDSGTSHCMTNHNHDYDMGDGFYQPHDIAVDNISGYWFTTAMMGTKVAMYSVEDNELVASYSTSSMPALLSIDEVNRKIYVSGGNPSMGETNKILELTYNENSLELVEEWDVQFTYAHGIHFDESSGYVFAVSKTVDYIAKFNPNEPQVPFVNPIIISMDSDINDNFTIETKRLWPIDITGKYPYIFVTCSAGDWNFGSEYEQIPGQVQMWHMEDMNLLTTYEFDAYSRPWHIEVSPIEDKFYVALSGGDGENGSSNSGAACIEYSAIDNQYSMNESWRTTSSEYGNLHGITLHSDCEGNYHVYSTGRTDGNIYKFDALTGEQLNSANLVLTGSVRTGGIDSFIPPCNDICCD